MLRYPGTQCKFAGCDRTHTYLTTSSRPRREPGTRLFVASSASQGLIDGTLHYDYYHNDPVLQVGHDG